LGKQKIGLKTYIGFLSAVKEFTSVQRYGGQYGYLFNDGKKENLD